MKNKVQKILSKIATRKLCTMDEHMAFYNDTAKEDYRFLSEIEELIKALQEEPVSNELEKVVEEIVDPTVLNAYGTKELARRLRNTICGSSVSEDLEEAAIAAADEDMQGRQIMEESNENRQLYSRIFRRGFKAGGKWKKEQIIKRLCNHANIDQMTEKFEYKYKPENVLDTEYYKRGIFDTIKAIKEG